MIRTDYFSSQGKKKKLTNKGNLKKYVNTLFSLKMYEHVSVVKSHMVFTDDGPAPSRS